MSLSSLSKSMLSATSIKNVKSDTARAKMSVEEMKIRTSALGIVQLLTKSKTLDTYLNAKIRKQEGEKKSKEDIARAELEKKSRDTEFQFKAYTLRTLNGLRRKMDIVGSIAERNSKLVENLVNDIGRSKRGKKINVANPTSARAPFQDKTVKGQLDKINAELDKLKKVEIKKRRSIGISAPRLKKKDDKVSKSELEELMKDYKSKNLLTTLIQGAMLGTGVGALSRLAPLAKGLFRGAGIVGKGLSLYNLPGAISNTMTRFQGKDVNQDPFKESLSRATTPLALSAGAYSATRVGQQIYRKFKPAGSPVDKMASKFSSEAMRKDSALREKLAARYEAKTQYQAPKKNIASAERYQKYQQKLWDQGKYAESDRISKARASVGSQRDSAARSLARKAQDTGLVEKQKLSERIGASTTSKLLKNEKELLKWRKISGALSKVGKRVPAASLAYLAYKVSEMSNYVSDYSQGRISHEKYKEQMVSGYGDIASNLGSTALGALLGGLAGSVFPGIGTLGGALVGGAGGFVASLFMDDSTSAHYIGTKLFEVLNEDKSAKSTKMASESKAAADVAAASALKTAKMASESKSATSAAAASAPKTAKMVQGSAGMQTPAATGSELKAVSESGNAKEAMTFFISKGWTKEQSAGIVGNLMAESGTTMKTNLPGDGGEAYGIAQWHPDRQQNFAKQFGKPIQQAGFKEQLEFVNWELNNTEKAAGVALRAATAPDQAAIIIDAQYERSSGSARQKRIDFAKKLVDDKYTGAPDTTVKTKSGLTLQTSVNGAVVKGTMSNDQYAVLASEADRASNPGSLEWDKDRLSYLKTHYSPEIVRAFEMKQRETMTGVKTVNRTNPPEPEAPKEEPATKQEVANAHAAGLVALSKTKALDKGIGILADQAIDAKKAIASQIPFPSIKNPEHSFKTYSTR